MAVSEQTPYREYTANGSASSFALEFDCDNQDHLIVLVDDVEPVVGTWSLIGGAVVFGTAPINGKKITIQRNTPVLRSTNFQSFNNSFRPDVINKDLDRVWLRLQEEDVAKFLLNQLINMNYADLDEKGQNIRTELIDELTIQADELNQKIQTTASQLNNQIIQQGVSQQQLQNYYSFLQGQMANLSSEKNWVASLVVDASGKTQQQINNGLNSISELPSIGNLHHGLKISVKNYHSDGLGIGGDFVYASELSKNMHDGGYFIDPTKVFPTNWADRTQQDNWFNVKNLGTGVFVRIPTGYFNVEQWGVRADEVSEEDIALNAIIQSIPEGATLNMIDRKCTILVDAKKGSLAEPAAAWKINRKVTVLGTVGCTVKMKDFCTAWLNYTTVIDTVQITATDAKVLHLCVDPNADNHYQVASDGHKWWEAAPAPLVAKRPPHGIIVRCFSGQPNTKNVEVAYNFVTRPLTGVGAIGSGVGSDSQDFYDKKLAVGCVENAKIHSNSLYRCRGNDVMFVSGVINSVAYNNISENSYYHSSRMYSGCVGCSMWKNNAVYNYKKLEALYNSTDNGYYRTTDALHSLYKIQRSGIRLGSGYSDLIPNAGGNIRDSFISDCDLTYVGGLSSIIDEESTQGASTSLINVAFNCSIFNVKSYDSPFWAAVILNTPTESFSSPKGCSIKNNEYYRTRRSVVLQSDNSIFSDNKLSDCYNDPASFISVIRARQANPHITGNTIEFSTKQADGRAVIELETATKGFVDNNAVKNIRPQIVVTAANSEVFGSNASGKKIPLVAAYTPVAATNVNQIANNLLNISGTITATSAVVVLAALETKFRPAQDEYFDFIVITAGADTTVGERFIGKITTFGSLQIILGGKVNIGTVVFSKTYQSAFFQLT